LIIRIAVFFTGSHYNVVLPNTGSDPASTSYLNFTQYDGVLTPQVIYNFYNSEQLQVFVGAGASLNFSGYNSYKYITKYTDGSFPDDVQDNSPSLSKFWISLPLQLGIAINHKIEINVSYIPSSSLTKDNIASANVTSYQAGINYFFGRK
jgi:hypothetical protein